MTDITETKEERAARYEAIVEKYHREGGIESSPEEHLALRKRMRIGIFRTVITEAIMDARDIDIAWEDIATVLGLSTEEAITQFESQVNRHRELLREEDSFGLPRASCPKSFD